jgi:hypothetical protein
MKAQPCSVQSRGLLLIFHAVFSLVLMTPFHGTAQEYSWKINKNLRCENGSVMDNGEVLFDFEIDEVAQILLDQIKEIGEKIRANKSNRRKKRKLKKKRNKKRKILKRLRACVDQDPIPPTPVPGPNPTPTGQDPETTPYVLLSREVKLEYCDKERNYFFNHNGPEAVCDIESYLNADANSGVSANECVDYDDQCVNAYSTMSCGRAIDQRYSCTATAVELLRCSKAITDALNDKAEEYNCRAFFYGNPPEYSPIDVKGLPGCRAVKDDCPSAFGTFPQ